LVEERVNGKRSLVRQRSCPMGIPTGKTAGWGFSQGDLFEGVPPPPQIFFPNRIGAVVKISSGICHADDGMNFIISFIKIPIYLERKLFI